MDIQARSKQCSSLLFSSSYCDGNREAPCLSKCALCSAHHTFIARQFCSISAKKTNIQNTESKFALAICARRSSKCEKKCIQRVRFT